MTRIHGIAALILAVASLLAVGCGGGGGGGSNDQSANAAASGGGDVGSAAACLLEANWILAPGEDTIEGTSELGVPFTIVYFDSPAEAKKMTGKAGDVVGRTVVTYLQSGREQFTEDVKITPAEKNTLEQCVLTGELPESEQE